MVNTDKIVLYPSAGRGHLTCMVELAKLMLTHHPSLSLTIVIVIATAPFETGSTASYLDSVSAAVPSITFLHLPAVDFPVDPSSRGYSPAIYFRFARANNPNFRQLLSSLSPVKALIIDFFCDAAFQVGTELSIPTYYFAPSWATSLAVFLYFPTIHKTVPGSLKDSDGFIAIPGLPPIRAKDMPNSMLDRSTDAYTSFLATSSNMAKSAGIIRNTFHMLEPTVITAISDGRCVPDGPTPPLYCIGPLLIPNTSPASGGDEERHECLKWLDSQPSESVLLLSFGSLGLFSSRQLKEIATALERSGVRFLWVVRNPPPGDEMWKTATAESGLDELLPAGFLENTKNIGFVIKNWLPQVEAVNHESVGGFVTHCGMNSLLEAVSAGMPMVAWPRYAEQKLNAVLVEEAKLALPLDKAADGFVTADELEKRVRELMWSEKGKVVRERVRAMKHEAVAALSEGGSSLRALAKLVDSFHLLNT